jgi:NADH-quinone oxidoreductase subunit L
MLPTTFIAYSICAAALVGLPFFSGFLSKEAILGGAFHWAGAQMSGLAYLVPIVLVGLSGLTALYMARQWRLIFLGKYHNEEELPTHVHEPDWLMRGPIVLLTILSVWIWFAVNPFSGHASWFFRILPVAEEAAIWWLAPLSIGLVLLGGWIGFQMQEPDRSRGYVRLSQEYGFLDTLYQYLIINPTHKLATLLYRTDQRVVDGVVNGAGVTTVVLAQLTHVVDRFGVDGVVNGAAWLAAQLGRMTRSVQSGRVQSYITVAVVGLLVLLWWLL